MKNKKQILLPIVSLGIFGTLFVAFLLGRPQLKKLEEGKQKVEMEQVSGEISSTPTMPALPTLTEEEIETISKIETLEIKITAGGFKPASLTIKPHDQVDWVNEVGEVYQVKGEDWGGVEIGPGRRFTQSFEKVGVYPYSCQLHPEITGKIIVE